ncbi:MAG TPA: L,D-transpeptidase [Thermoleophilaceae bacterium]|nr:L,D-transpeptidase [Thermoleophilaceae bacterium]
MTVFSSLRGHRKTRNGSGPRARSLLVCLVVLAAAAGASPAQAAHHASHWAFVDARAAAHAKPSAASRVVARLDTKTQDGTDELVLILSQRHARDGVWFKVRLPVLPNNTTGWVKASRMSTPRPVDTWLRVNRAHERMTLTRRGRVIFRARIGVGRPESPTPAGNFYIRDKLTGFPPGTLYGPLAFGTSARSAVLTDWPKDGVIGIHGTNEPGLLPGHVSHGCMRLRNEDILRLAKLLPIGTPLTIT